MSLDDFTWLLALESALDDGSDIHEIISITRGRSLPEEHRSKIWYLCLGGGNKINSFSQFDEIFDLPEQSVIRANCKALVDKLGNDEEDKVSIVCDTESVFTHYCKSRHLKFDQSKGWADILTPLLAVKMPRDHIYTCFEEILEKYIPRETDRGAPIYHLIRLLVLYHDPELTTVLDSKKITPDSFSTSWMRSLFSSICTLDAIAPLWDIYFQERDPFFILFLALVILLNARDQIIEMNGESREKIIETLTNIPSALSMDEVVDFCSYARYYAMKTPITFRKEFSTLIFGSVYMGKSESENLVGNLPVSQALCLPVSAEEILVTYEVVEETDIEQEVGFFLVDCRPSEQYNAGHLPNAFHLDSNLMLQQLASFLTAVQGLFMAQRQAVASGTPGCGKHLCFIGSGREVEDQYVHMVVASFLQRNTQYVSLVKGGYQAIHRLLEHNLSESLTDHDPKKCIVCFPESQPNFTNLVGNQDDLVVSSQLQTNGTKSPEAESFLNKFSSVFKSKSTQMKGKLVEYITNPNASHSPIKCHVSSNDKGRLYRDNGDVFSLLDDDETPGRSGEADKCDQFEHVNIPQWLKKPDVINSFQCRQLRENGYMFPSYILLTETLMFVIKEAEGRKNEGYVIARRTLASIVKIMSKKKQPEIITFKYGSIHPDGEVSITDIDRFIIMKASEATKAIKEQIMKLMAKEET